MARRARTTPVGSWQIRSVAVRQRDGPARLRQAYRLLLASPTPSSDCPPSEEEHDARRDLRPGLDRAPGPRADHR